MSQQKSPLKLVKSQHCRIYSTGNWKMNVYSTAYKLWGSTLWNFTAESAHKPRFSTCMLGWLTHLKDEPKMNIIASRWEVTFFRIKLHFCNPNQAKCDFKAQTAVLRFWAPFGGRELRSNSNIRWSSSVPVAH